MSEKRNVVLQYIIFSDDAQLIESKLLLLGIVNNIWTPRTPVVVPALSICLGVLLSAHPDTTTHVLAVDIINPNRTHDKRQLPLELPSIERSGMHNHLMQFQNNAFEFFGDYTYQFKLGGIALTWLISVVQMDTPLIPKLITPRGVGSDLGHDRIPRRGW